MIHAVKRILKARKWKAEKQLIATAIALEDRLLVLGCNLRLLSVPFDSLAALRRIEKGDRSDFTISEEGSYIHWEKADIHLDFENFLWAADPVERERLDRYWAEIQRKHDAMIEGEAIDDL